MNVKNLKDILDDFGDHLPVVIVVDEESEEMEGGDVVRFTVGTQYIGGMITVVLLANKQEDWEEEEEEEAEDD